MIVPELALVEKLAVNDTSEALDDVFEDFLSVLILYIELLKDVVSGNSGVCEVSDVDTLRKIHASHLLLQELTDDSLGVSVAESHLMLNVKVLDINAGFFGSDTTWECANWHSRAKIIVGKLDHHR